MPQFNPFPVGYQPYTGGYQYQYQPQQIPMNNWNMPSAQMPQQSPAVQQDMTPVIHMDIKQVESVEAISKNPPATGTTGAYMTKDEKTIVFRSVYANGEYTDKVYEERPPEPPAPTFDPAEYMRKDEFDERVNAIVTAKMAHMVQQTQATPVTTPKRVTKKEAND